MRLILIFIALTSFSESPSMVEMNRRLKKVHDVCVKNNWSVFSTRIHGMSFYNAEIPIWGRISDYSLQSLRNIRFSIFDKFISPQKPQCKEEEDILYDNLMAMLIHGAKENNLSDSGKSCLALCATKVMLKMSKGFDQSSILGNSKKVLRHGGGACTEYAIVAKSLINDLGIEADTAVSLGNGPNLLNNDPLNNIAIVALATAGHSFVQVKLEDNKWYYADPLEALDVKNKSCIYYSKDPRTLFNQRNKLEPFDEESAYRGFSNLLRKSHYFHIDPFKATENQNLSKKIIEKLKSENWPYLITPTVEEGVYRLATFDVAYREIFISIQNKGLFKEISNSKEPVELKLLIESFLSR